MHPLLLVPLAILATAAFFCSIFFVLTVIAKSSDEFGATFERKTDDIANWIRQRLKRL